MGAKAAARKKNKRRRALRSLTTVLALTLAAALLLLGALLIAPLTERVDETPVAGSADWMARLDDGLYLNEIVLPGSHASAAQFVSRAFFNKCQAMDLGEQLDAGVRYLELSLAAEGKSLRLDCAGAVCRTGLLGGALSFDAALEQCCAFLEAHPAETVLLAVSCADGDGSLRGFQLLLDSYVREKPERWLLTDAIPTLGEARGRLVLLRRYEDEARLARDAGLPLLWADQSGYGEAWLSAAVEDQGSYLLCVQDRREYAADDKWDAFLDGIRSTEDGAVSLNYLSTKGEAAYGHPYEFAKDLNARLLEAEDGALGGWIVCDFVSPTLAERIYRLNF